jgi:3D (Asp-Asp-Asp) domain-containing protein
MPPLICSIFFSSLLCFNQPIICNQTYDKKATFTAYNLTASQTDEEPCVGAGNHNLCEISKQEPSKCIIATRLYNLHTILNVEGFGECEVLDRTSKKYGDRIDILFPTKQEAIQFGKKEIRYRIIK